MYMCYFQGISACFYGPFGPVTALCYLIILNCCKKEQEPAIMEMFYFMQFTLQIYLEKNYYHIGCYVHKCMFTSARHNLFAFLLFDHFYSKKIIKFSNADALIHLMQNVSNTVNNFLFQSWLSQWLFIRTSNSVVSMDLYQLRSFSKEYKLNPKAAPWNCLLGSPVSSG